jgi:hypothetical protein
MGTVDLHKADDLVVTGLDREERLYAALKDLVDHINGFEPPRGADGTRMSKYEVLHNAEAALGEFASRH